jgi:hypothetical protein
VTLSDDFPPLGSLAVKIVFPSLSLSFCGEREESTQAKAQVQSEAKKVKKLDSNTSRDESH